MPLVKQQPARDMLDSHLGTVLFGAGLPNVRYIRDWCEMNLPTFSSQSVAEVGLLTVHKIRFVKAAHGFESFAANGQSRSHNPRHGLRLSVGKRSLLVLAENRHAANELT